MWNVLTALWSGIVGFFAVFLPLGKSAARWSVGPAARVALHIIVLVVILVGLFFLNRVVFARDVGPAFIRPYWLPLIFALVYLLLWVTWWIWKLLQTEPEGSDFPDIDRAWDLATRALGQAGIRLGDLPLFLVLGRPQGPEEHLFNAAQLQLVVKQSPPEPQEPVHVYATREAIYVTCAGASLLGKHAANVALEGIDVQSAATADPWDESADTKTLRPTGSDKKVIKKLSKMVGGKLSAMDRREIRRESNFGMPDLLKNPPEVARLRARLAHLGRLIVRDRQPYCPINGLLVLVPIGGTDTEADAQLTANVCAGDLATVRRVLQMQCPILVVACDVEEVPGFPSFIERVPAKDRLGRLGQRFPLASPELAGEALHDQIDKSIHYLCNSYLRDWVFRLFRVDAAGGQDPIPTNTGLYLFLDEMRNRKKNLARVLTQGVAKDGPVPLLYAGCYLAATGGDRDRDQAFVAGVFKRLVENQSYVSWTEQALAEDRKCQARANLGYSLLGGLVLMLVAGLGFMWMRRH